MTLFLLAVAAGAVGGLLRGGRPGHFRGLRLHAPVVVWVAVGIQLALGSRFTSALPTGIRFGLVVVSTAASGAWLVYNARRQAAPMKVAFAVVAAGWLLNLLVIIPNGGMPVSEAAHRAAGAPGGDSIEAGSLWKHVREDGDTVLRPLGDVIPLRRLNAVVSVGDLVMLAGLAVVAAVGLGPARPGTHTTPTLSR